MHRHNRIEPPSGSAAAGQTHGRGVLNEPSIGHSCMDARIKDSAVSRGYLQANNDLNPCQPRQSRYSPICERPKVSALESPQSSRIDR